MDAKTLKAVGEALQSSSFRKSFDKDPMSALVKKGIDVAKVDVKVLDVLADLNSEELKAIGVLGRNMSMAGLKDVAADVIGGIVF